MSLRLLIVDDSRMSRLILQGLILQAHPQWTIVHASSGEEALQLVRENPVDLVSMDFNMNGMNGLEAALALREILPAVPIAILTANVQTAVQGRIEEAGMVFIAKPITASAASQLAALAEPDMTVQLDTEQIDALSEIFNIGVGKAAAAMGSLMRDEVLLSVPHVSIFTVSEAAQQLGAAGSTMYGVRQPFRGTFNGDALLIFPGHKSLEIVRIVAGQSVPGEDLSAIEQDAMTEVGNVMLNACIAALSDLLGNEFQLSPPSIDVGDSRTILGTRIQNHLVVFLHIRFELLSSQIEGFVVFVLNTTSLEGLRAAVNRLLGRPAEMD